MDVGIRLSGGHQTRDILLLDLFDFLLGDGLPFGAVQIDAEALLVAVERQKGRGQPVREQVRLTAAFARDPVCICCTEWRRTTWPIS